jgi:pimeloyl-ACP methyl ester carboxylesterase
MENLQFEALAVNEAKLPSLQFYETHDGQQLAYRYYDADTTELSLILLHGSAYHSRYLQPLASYLAEHGVANIYTPDMRGHGPKTTTRGDVKYIGQLENDISDLVHYARQHQNGAVILGGHSSRGGAVIRYAGGDNAAVEGYLLLAPYIHYNAPTAPPKNQWANANVLRIIGLNILNGLGITVFNHLDVISFSMPDAVRDGTETLQYSYTLQMSMHPHGDYGNDIASLDASCLVLVGADDEVFKAKSFKQLFASYSPETRVTVVPGISHFGVVTKHSAQVRIASWLRRIGLSLKNRGNWAL